MYKRAVELLEEVRDLCRQNPVVSPMRLPKPVKERIGQIAADLRGFPPFSNASRRYLRVGYRPAGYFDGALYATQAVELGYKPVDVVNATAELIAGNEAEFETVWELAGLTVRDSTALSYGFTVEPAKEWPADDGDIWLRSMKSIVPEMFPWRETPPRVVRRFKSSPVFTAELEGPDEELLGEESGKFSALLDGLRLLATGHVTVVRSYTKPVLPHFPIWGCTSMIRGQDPSSGGLETSDLARLQALIEGIGSFDPDARASLGLAIEKFSESKRCVPPASQAVSLGIALEILTTYNDDAKGDIAERISIRGALLVANSLDEGKRVRSELKDFYRHRSKAVHTGKVDARFGQRSEAFRTRVRDIVFAIIAKGRFPVWEDLQLSALSKPRSE